MSLRLHLPLLLALLLAQGCSSTPTRVPASPAAAYRETVAALQAEFTERGAQVSHQKHRPRLYLHGGPRDVVVVLVHGLFESPFHVTGIAEALHARGYNVVVPLLARHWAIPLEDINNVTYEEWLEQYLGILKRARTLGRKVLLAGYSAGGLLSIYGAVIHPELVDGLLLWSPALALNNKAYYASWAGALLAGRVDIDYNKMAGKPPQHPEHVAFYSPVAGNEISKLGGVLLTDYAAKNPFSERVSWWLRKSAYSSIRVPVFLVRPEHDEVVSTKEMDYFFDVLESPKDRLIMAGEDHSSISKGPKDYSKGVQRPNKKFRDMLRKLNDFLSEKGK